MNHPTIGEIEDLLAIRVPDEIVKILSEGGRGSTSQLTSSDPFGSLRIDGTYGLIGDPMSLLVANLNLRDMVLRNEVFPYELREWLLVGHDDQVMLLWDSKKVIAWDGFSLNAGGTLAATMHDRIWPRIQLGGVSGEERSLVVSKVNPSWQSVLNPITPTEWSDYIASDRDLTPCKEIKVQSPVDPNVFFPSPLPHWWSQWNTQTMGTIYLNHQFGRLELDAYDAGYSDCHEHKHVDSRSAEAEEKMRHIADALRAVCSGA